MTIRTATPYLTFAGKAGEAIAHYERALGAKVETLQKFAEVAPDSPEAKKGWVMHAHLKFGGTQLMLSDGSPEDEAVQGGAVHVALDFDDGKQARAVFDALSAGGKVTQPLIDAPWGAMFGAFQDKFGINWMFNSAKG